MSLKPFFHRLLKLSALVVYSLLLIALFGKLVFFPVALVGPAGDGSPAFVGLATYLPIPPRGRILFCVDSLRTSCVLSEFGTSGEPCYSVLVEVPDWAWSLAALAAVAAPLYLATKRGEMRVLAGLALALLAINSVAVGSLYVNQGDLKIEVKSVELKRGWLDLAGGVYEAELDLGVYEIVGATCALEGFGEAEVEVSGSLLRVRVPREYFAWLYQVRSAEKPYLPPPPVSLYQAFTISCSVRLDRGRLESRFVTAFSWREPAVRSEGSRVVVVNENPIGLEVRLEATSRDAGVAWESKARVEPLGELVVDLSGTLKSGSYEVRIVYEFMGASRAVKVDVSVG
ncbi:MAG: hypothetical protein QXX12_08095 [Nanopusillaceae archaeon]